MIQGLIIEFTNNEIVQDIIISSTPLPPLDEPYKKKDIPGISIVVCGF